MLLDGGSDGTQPGCCELANEQPSPGLQGFCPLPDVRLGFKAPAPMQLELAVGSLRYQYGSCISSTSRNSITSCNSITHTDSNSMTTQCMMFIAIPES